MQAPLPFCTYLLLMLSCFVCVLPTNGFFVINCVIKGSLKYPANLKALCNKRELCVIPHNIPDQTRVLDLSYNHLMSIKKKDLIYFTKLTHLNVSHNWIKDIKEGAFRSLTALQELNLAHNNLHIISGGSFQNLFNLTVLRLDENQITNISASAFDPLISLVMVNLSGNHLAHIHEVQPLFQLLNIQELHIGRNGFSSFQTPQVSNTSLKLRVLDLSWNPLRVFRITADVFPHLESLGLAFSNESMTWDVQDASYLRNVSTLNLTGIEMNEEIKSVLQTFNTSLTNLSLYRLKEKTLIKTACLINPLRTLHVQSSRLASISAKELTGCTDLVTLDLSENSLRNITNLAFGFMTNLKRLSLSRNKLDSVPPAIWNLSSLEVLDLSYNSIYNLTCSDFNSLAQLQTLYLSRNPLYSVKPFQNLTNLKTLIISSSRLISVTNCFRACLQKLEFLDLTQNKLNYIHKEDFGDLKSLKHLLLNDNQITTIDKGAFEGLQKLTVLNLQSNKITQSSLKASVFSGLTNLKYLLLNNNYLSYSDQSNLVKPPFRYLKSLETLAIHSQGHKGMLNFPSNFLEGLTSLQVLTAGNLNLNFLYPNTFSHSPRLLSLDLSRNELTTVSQELFTPLKRLNRLHMFSTGLQSMDFLMQANLTEIQYLQISKNELAVINETFIASFTNLTYIDLQGNPFSCDCSNALFVDWAIRNNVTQVVNADQLTCNYPSKLRGNKLMELDFESCTVDKGFFCFISTTVFILLIMFSSILYHFLKWQVVYAYYRLLAFLYKSNQQRKTQSSGYQYDAFISYNTHDELWVMSELLPHVEGEQGWKLCLHHRDFQPGKPIIDNIVDGINRSRKTICVISRHYLESEWCSREIQVASFRLFDEKKDVLILVFLENIPPHQLSPYYRMRKLIKKRTYISWPKPGEDTRVFWEKLRMALEAKESSKEENPILSGISGT
ncbi:toll-like receptor 13 [Pygocentrus nattereri]|uniref:TIR domain-containing protein n=1 Tax=Pygocentrus nattereri TaxID=42514 RepID=A0A3B4E5X3_PYGNA|nr:toll-like receptor 13 [Pygocentrus nattereri]